jgi:hypothetical protein
VSNTIYKLSQVALTTALSAAAVLIAGTNSQERGQEKPASSATAKIDAYFPPGAVDGFGDYFSSYLRFAGEPSLFALAEDPRAISYRFDWLAGQSSHFLAIRLSLSPDGSGLLTSTEILGAPEASHKKELNVSPPDVMRFLQTIEKADFWSMPNAEGGYPRASQRSYKLDASTWVFEGVRGGRYHVTLRRAPETSPYTDMVDYLVRDLAKLDKSAIPHAYPSPPPTITATPESQTPRP